MKTFAIAAVLTAITVTPAMADSWAFDSQEKVTGNKVGAVWLETQEAKPSWTFCEADSTYMVKVYDSYAFE